MGFLLDTSIAIHARDGTPPVLQRLARHDGEALLSSLSLAELLRGVYKDPALTAIRSLRLNVLLKSIPVLSFDAAAAQAYGQIIAQCGWIRSRDFDRMIAGHALATHSTLVTSNEADFRDIPGLMIQNWAVE